MARMNPPTQLVLCTIIFSITFCAFIQWSSSCQNENLEHPVFPHKEICIQEQENDSELNAAISEAENQKEMSATEEEAEEYQEDSEPKAANRKPTGAILMTHLASLILTTGIVSIICLISYMKVRVIWWVFVNNF